MRKIQSDEVHMKSKLLVNELQLELETFGKFEFSEIKTITCRSASFRITCQYHHPRVSIS